MPDCGQTVPAESRTNIPMQFDQFATDYRQVLDQCVALSGEDSAYFGEYKARYLARLLGADFGGRVLDFGCGIGVLSGFLKKHLRGVRIDGYDVSRESLRRVEPSLARGGCFTSNLEELPGNYDLVIVANVMHHIAIEQRQPTMQMLAPLMASGARLALFEHNPANPVTRRAVDRCPFDESAILLPMREAIGYLSHAGLRLQRRDFIVFMPRFLAWFRPLEPWLAWLPLGAQYVLIGEKHA